MADIRASRTKWTYSVIAALSISIGLNIAAVLWNSDPNHYPRVGWFFVAGSLIAPGFENGIVAVVANTVVVAILLWSLIFAGSQMRRRLRW